MAGISNVNYYQDIGGNLSYAKDSGVGSSAMNRGTSGSGGMGSSGGGNTSNMVMSYVQKGVGTMMKSYAAYAAWERKEFSSKYNKAMIDTQRIITNASFDMDRRRVERSGERLLSSQRSAISKSGLEMSGSPVDVMQDTQKEIELNLFNVKYNKMVSDLQYDIAWRQEDIAQDTAKLRKMSQMFAAFSEGMSSM